MTRHSSYPVTPAELVLIINLLKKEYLYKPCRRALEAIFRIHQFEETPEQASVALNISYPTIMNYISAFYKSSFSNRVENVGKYNYLIVDPRFPNENPTIDFFGNIVVAKARPLYGGSGFGKRAQENFKKPTNEGLAQELIAIKAAGFDASDCIQIIATGVWCKHNSEILETMAINQLIEQGVDLCNKYKVNKDVFQGTMILRGPAPTFHVPMSNSVVNVSSPSPKKKKSKK